jgi:hypothetical protein
MSVFPLTIPLSALSAWITASAGTDVTVADGSGAVLTGDLPGDHDAPLTGDLRAHLPADLSAAELLVSLVAAALEPAAGELEQLDNLPTRDDGQFDGRPMPEVERLAAWLYAPTQRIAHAVHTPSWRAPVPFSPADQPSLTLGRRAPARQNWDALLRDHFHSGQGWTPVSAVAMPLRLPFDEPGLKIAPLLALWSPVSADEQWLSETMTTSVRHGAPHVVRVQVFSAAMYVRSLHEAGHETVEVLPRRRTAGIPA